MLKEAFNAADLASSIAPCEMDFFGFCFVTMEVFDEHALRLDRVDVMFLLLFDFVGCRFAIQD